MPSLLFALLMLLILLLSTPARAELEDVGFRTFDTPRFILHIGADRRNLDPQPVSIADIADQSIEILNKTYDELSRVFRAQPKKKVVLRFLSPEEFRRKTGAPAWTSAMYFRDEITIPLNSATLHDKDELSRALRHEYVHAFIAELSNYRCPAWLDEGVAQLLEGQANPLLGPALRDWVRVNPAIPLDWLRNGFTTLESAFVPAAYAQSLFATRRLVHLKGFGAITTYLKLLREEFPEDHAFRSAFGRTKRQFEKELTAQMRRWSQSRQLDP